MGYKKEKKGRNPYLRDTGIALECLNPFIDIFYETWMFYADNLAGRDGEPWSTPLKKPLLVHTERQINCLRLFPL